MKVFTVTCAVCGKEFQSVSSCTKYCDEHREFSKKGFVNKLWHGKWVYTDKDSYSENPNS